MLGDCDYGGDRYPVRWLNSYGELMPKVTQIMSPLNQNPPIPGPLALSHRYAVLFYAITKLKGPSYLS